jgi:sulfatase maturation enzyme AslB (radical SAM superfamily)
MDTFCVLPWYSLELPANSPCCLLPKNTDIVQVKKDLLTGIKSTACVKCWTIESRGEKSRRQLENEFLDYKLDRDLELIKQDCVAIQISPLVYQITTSNLCNQACVSCNSKASTKWAEIEKRMGIAPTQLTELDLKNIDIDYSTARRISLLGGEPFFDPATFTILENLVKHKNTDCFISIVTNGSIKLSQSKLDLLSKFTDLNICISIDGVGPVFEYMRWPAKWPTILDNIEKFKKITKNISISYTISSLNVLYYQQTVNWFQSQNLRYNHNIVTHPEWLSFDSMPTELKQLLAGNEFATSWLTVTGKEISLKDYQEKIYAQDRAKRINIKDYLPEISTTILNN